MALAVTKHVITIMVHGHCYSVIIVITEVHVICQMASIHWSGKEARYTDQLPVPSGVAGELVPFWAISFILLLQLISVYKENPGQQSQPQKRS